MDRINTIRNRVIVLQGLVARGESPAVILSLANALEVAIDNLLDTTDDDEQLILLAKYAKLVSDLKAKLLN